MKKLGVVVASVMMMGSATYANEVTTYNMGLKVGTLGLGLDVSTPVNDELAVRFNINGLTYSRTELVDDVDYDGDLELLTAGVLLDYYPYDSAFRLSGGVYYNNNQFTGTAVPSGLTTVNIDDVEYTAKEIGQLTAEATFNNFAPYIGMGWGNDTRQKGWGFTFDLGVMYHGEPQADLAVTRGTGLPADGGVNDAAFAVIEANVAAEQANFENDSKDFKFYPVIMLGVNYTF